MDAVGALALQIHVNAAQEIVMPEGQRIPGLAGQYREITAAMERQAPL